MGRLANAAAKLIAELPDDAGDLTVENMQALIDLREKIAAVNAKQIDKMREMRDLAKSRGWGSNEPIGRYITKSEADSYEHLEYRALDADSAYDALRDWEERAGYDLTLRRIAPVAGTE